MRKFIGEEKLIQASQNLFSKGITKICDDIYFLLGYGESTATLIIGESSCILIDSLSSKEAAQEALEEFKKITDKPIKTIIYTHYQHPDHIGGSGVFADEECKIIGRSPLYRQNGRVNMLDNIYKIRGAKQFGIGLTQQESISIGIGPSKNPNDTKSILPPNTIFKDESLSLNIDGVEIELIAAPGETDDQVFVWLPKYKVLCCGDNYYSSWPNLYAIRGGGYRDIDTWVSTLSKMIEYNAHYLLPGHTKAVIGESLIKETLTNYRDAIEYVLVKTLEGMNEGKTADELCHSIKLPKHLLELPYLQEYYGTVEWTIRSIFCGYLGWFSGNPTHLGSIEKNEKANKMIDLIGGKDKILEAIKSAINNEEEQWALELCDILIDANYLEEVKSFKAEALRTIGRMQTSANARHYYLKCSKELLKK